MDTRDLTDSERELLIKGVQNELEQLEKEIQILHQRKNALGLVLKKLQAKSSADDEPKKPSFLKTYGLSWKGICMESLRKIQNFQATGDVYDYLIERYPESKNANKNKTLASLSWALSQLARQNEVVQIERKFSKGHLWGLPEWFNVDGFPIGDFEKELLLKGVPEFKYKRAA